MACVQFYSLSHRAKSLSTPTLAGANKQSQGQCPSLSTSSNPVACFLQLCLRLIQERRGSAGGRPCPQLSRKGSRYWRRWRKGPSCWLTTAGSVSGAAAFTRSPFTSPWKGEHGCLVFKCTSFIYPLPFILQLAPRLLQVWVSGQPEHLSTPVCCAEFPPATLRRRWLL